VPLNNFASTLQYTRKFPDALVPPDDDQPMRVRDKAAVHHPFDADPALRSTHYNRSVWQHLVH
jgi:hypothetical protein